MTLSPVSLSVDEFAAMLNLELSDHPVYDGLELQWFNDDVHGTGMLAFLSRRSDRRIDYYSQPGLHLDRACYDIGAGVRSWNETEFDIARLQVSEHGVDAEARFTDVDGRSIEIVVNDLTKGGRDPAPLLAPIGDGVTNPTQLLLVWLPRFDLAHITPTEPIVRIGGLDAAITRLPGRLFHRRHLVKYAAPVVTVSVGRRDDPAFAELSDSGQVIARSPHHEARLTFTPPWPELRTMAEDHTDEGGWEVTVDGSTLTGGSWRAHRDGDSISFELDVTQPWTPGSMPPLMGFVTRVVPVFRQWPTTYQWRASLSVADRGNLTSRWERVT